MSKVIVTLIEDAPKDREKFRETYWSNGVDDIEAGYQKYRERFQPYRWIAKSAGNGEVLAKSTESYFNAVDCERAIELLFSMSTAVELVRVEAGVEARRPLR